MSDPLLYATAVQVPVIDLRRSFGMITSCPACRTRSRRRGLSVGCTVIGVLCLVLCLLGALGALDALPGRRGSVHHDVVPATADEVGTLA